MEWVKEYTSVGALFFSFFSFLFPSFFLSFFSKKNHKLTRSSQLRYLQAYLVELEELLNTAPKPKHWELRAWKYSL